MGTLRFGTDGWRAVIARDFTFANLSRIVEGTARWLLQKYPQPKVMIGYDCRFMAGQFAEAVAQQLAGHGIKVYLSPSFATTPMVSLATVQHQCHLGIVLTASHNPPRVSRLQTQSPLRRTRPRLHAQGD